MLLRTLRRAGAVLGRHDPRRDPDERRLERQLRRARSAWLEEMASWRDDRGVVRLPADPSLEQRYLEHCRVPPGRHALLEHMERGAVAAEVGVETGRFSRAILDIALRSRDAPVSASEDHR